MLQITIPAKMLWDETKEEFVHTKEYTLTLEHSLVSLSKWEAKWRKAFLSKKEKTYEETIDYIKCMTLTQNVDPDVYKYLTNENLDQIYKYIEDPMTAVYFREDKSSGRSNEVVTSELIYYWMFSFGIPYECRKWHLNSLLALIKVFNMKNQPPKRRSKRDIMADNARINAENRKRWNSKG